MTAVLEAPVVPEGLVLASSVAALRDAISDRSSGTGRGRVGFVPTMGALHEGHASLIEEARRLVDGPVVVSIFVNPLQFAAGEDLDRYPRTLAADLEVCATAGADIVFAPSVAEVYPAEPAVTVSPGPLGTILEGAVRPTHFSGVLTVVAKLFGLVRPDLAVFGEKDYQQLTLIRRMVADLNMGIEVVGAPTVRDSDGLAKSSRNRYLSDDERTAALLLSAALRAAVDAAPRGRAAAEQAGLAVLEGRPEIELDYFVVRAADLSEPPPAGGDARVLVAARVGTTRLIDNLPLTVGAAAPETV